MIDFEINYGLVAIDLETSNRNPVRLDIIHFCGYSKKPNKIDRQELQKELEVDEELGCVGKNFLILEAPKSVVEFYRNKVEGK